MEAIYNDGSRGDLVQCPEDARECKLTLEQMLADLDVDHVEVRRVVSAEEWRRVSKKSRRHGKQYF